MENCKQSVFLVFSERHSTARQSLCSPCVSCTLIRHTPQTGEGCRLAGEAHCHGVRRRQLLRMVNLCKGFPTCSNSPHVMIFRGTSTLPYRSIANGKLILPVPGYCPWSGPASGRLSGRRPAPGWGPCPMVSFPGESWHNDNSKSLSIAFQDVIPRGELVWENSESQTRGRRTGLETVWSGHSSQASAFSAFHCG